MRTLFFTTLFFTSVLLSAQRQECRKDGDTRYKENFEVKLNKDLYGVSFPGENRCLNAELKTSISSFFKRTHEREYQGVGSWTINIVKKGDRFYLLQTEWPLKLQEL